MMDKSRTRSTLTLLGGCASVIALGWSMPAAAQTAFQGNPSVVFGSATITRGTTDTIAVDGSETVINWTPSDTSGTGTIDFLPSGRTAQFTVNTSAPLSDYTVLNRILPVDGSGLPVSRIVALNGTVQSDLFGSTGGKIWFYAPGGIIAGPTSIFNVGSLVLTSNDIDLSGPNGGSLYGANGEIRFRGVAGSTAAVDVQAGAQINALAAGSYVALVAPRVVQAGTVNVDGSTAYVGAEAADITINSGLFDITITAGTTDANGVVHSGTTSGPASAGTGDPQRVYMVAVPKNNALTMLLSGNVGYAPAAAATPDGSAIVLSAGYDVAGGDRVTTRNGTATADAGFSIGTGDWQNDLTGAATGDIVIRPAATAHFLGNAAFSAERSITLRADQLAAITVDRDMALNAGMGTTGGRIDLLTFGGSGAVATNGQISVTGNLTLNASGYDSGFASVPPLIGADANGGTINLIATGGTIEAATLAANAVGYAGYGSDRSGNAAGGAITLSALTAAGPSGTEGGVLRFGSTSLDASAGSAFQVSLPPIDGGNAVGGSIALTGTSGVAIGGGLDLGTVSASAQATGGVASTGTAGSATGGNISVIVSSGTHQWQSFFADVSAAPGYATEGGGHGAAIPGATGIDIDISGTGKLDILNSVSLYADARSYGGGGASGGTLRGGRINIAAHDGGSFSIAQDLFASADASGYPAYPGSTFLTPGTPDAFGGTISIGAAGGSFSAAGLFAHASGSAGDAPDVAGNGFGGSVTLFASASGGQRGNFSLTDCLRLQCRVSADGNGAAGVNGSNGTGGSILLYASDADFSVLGELALHADGSGGGAASDGVAGRGGDGLGGIVTVESRTGAAGSGALTFGNLFLSAEGSSVPSIDGVFYNGGDAGSGTGGTVDVTIQGGGLTADLVDAQASGLGGAAAENCPTCEGGGTTSFQAGSGQGGSTHFLISGGTATIGTLALGAQGTGGEADGANDPQSVAALAGSGRGGAALLESQGGMLRLTTLTVDASGVGGLGASVFQADGAAGGLGTGGNAGLLMTAASSGQVVIDSSAIIRALGKGGIGGETGSDGPGYYLAGAGGGGAGGTVDVTLAGGQLTAPSLLISAEGIGGSGGDNGSDGPGGAAGDGTGGTARFSYLNEGHAIGDVIVKADGQGGQAGSNRFIIGFDINNNPIYDYGIGNGGAGGRGVGGSATMQVDVDPLFASLTISADGTGSMGGSGGTGSAGGVGTGGTATLNLAFGATTVSGALRVTAAGLGGTGGTGYDNSGGRGGDAFGGIATFNLSGSSTTLDAGDIGVLAEALGGAGGQGGLRSGAGLAGADGGSAVGGAALFDVSAGASATTGVALRVSGDATGGDGTVGTAGPVGGNGGAGGNAAAGSATLRISDARMVFSSALPKAPGYTISAVGQGGTGADGSAGTNAGLSGGSGGRGGDGTGGVATFNASNGDYALGGISLLADGAGGLGGIGGSGPGGASAGGATGFGSGGTATFGNGDGGTLLPGAQRLIDALFMSASGDAAGSVQFSDSSTAIDGGLRVNGSIALASLGAPVVGFSGISAGAAANVVQIGGAADFSSTGPISFAFAGTGGMAVAGSLTATSSTRIDLSHGGRPTGSDSLSADSILFTAPGDVSLLSAGALRAINGLTILSAGGNINLASGSALNAGGDVRLFAQSSLNGAGATVRAGGVAAIGLGGAGNILLGDLASGGLLDQADASGNALGMGGIAIGGDFAVSGRLDIGAGSGTLSAASIDIGTLAADTQQLTATSGTVRIGNALMSGDLIVNSSLLLGNADITGLLQVRAPGAAGFAQLPGTVAAGSIDIDAGMIASNGLTARSGDMLLRSASDLAVTDASAFGAIIMTASAGGLTIGNAFAGGSLTLSGLGITASTLAAGGQSLLDAGTGSLTVGDIASTGAITANGGTVSLGATGAMTIAQAIASTGALVLNAGGALSVANAGSAGTMTLNGGTIVATTLDAAGSLTATAAGSADFGSVTSQTGGILLNAGGLLSLSGVVSAGTIIIGSGDIAIGSTALIGSLGGTNGITFHSVNTQQPAYIGGNDVAGAYSLSAADLARAAAANIAIDAPARGVAGTPDIVLQDLTIGTANLPGVGALTIGTSGRLRVQGTLRLTGRSGQGGLALSAGQALEVIAGSGLIDISDGNGGLGGVLTLSSPNVIAATLSAIADVAAAGTLNARELRLAQNDGLVNDAGILRAGTIRVNATQAFFVQNSGVSASIFERRGFTANDLMIATQGAAPQIAINGQLARPTGGFITGLETIPLVAINGSYTLGSKVNGCLIGNPGACLSSGLDSRDTWNALLDPSVSVGRIFTLSLIELRDIVAQGYPPLIDEPVTGAGNEDLWERQCGSADQPACGDSGT
ncbi:histidine kinase [Sphingobium sp.]|uniref:histidine kinase n=1 Tax=Sphingobium sp. TaxID=1912891 RepID=UPI0028BE1CDE|nr:histidine kinase [Sphingobium sp.]